MQLSEYLHCQCIACWFFFSFPDTFIEHSLISLKRFNLFYFVRHEYGISFNSELLQSVIPTIQFHLISFAYSSECSVHLPKTKGQLTHTATTRASETEIQTFFYLILSTIHEYVLFYLLSYFSLMVTFFSSCSICVCNIFFSEYAHPTQQKLYLGMLLFCLIFSED